MTKAITIEKEWFQMVIYWERMAVGYIKPVSKESAVLYDLQGIQIAGEKSVESLIKYIQENEEIQKILIARFLQVTGQIPKDLERNGSLNEQTDNLEQGRFENERSKNESHDQGIDI